MRRTRDLVHSMTLRKLTPSLTIAFLACCACGGGAKNETTSQAAAVASEHPAPVTRAPVSASGNGSIAAGQPPSTAAADGSAIFARCSTCHQANGQGLSGLYPPLAGSEIVEGNPAAAIAVVLHGLQGPVSVRGQQFNSTMPPYGTGASLSDAEIAAVLSYVRGSWGNHAGTVTSAQVAATRAATSSHTGPLAVADVAALLK